MATKIFFDTEFTGLHQGTTLISIGCVSECGERFYAELDDYALDQVDNWIKENVTDRLWIQNPEFKVPDGVLYCVGNQQGIRNQLTQWLDQFDAVEMWGDCLAYDWVLFCQLWGHAFKIPQHISYMPFDICTYLKLAENDPDVNRVEFSGIEENSIYGQHNALFDALTIQACYGRLMESPT